MYYVGSPCGIKNLFTCVCVSGDEPVFVQMRITTNARPWSARAYVEPTSGALW